VADVERFARRASSYERGRRAEFHSRVVAASLETAVRVVPHPSAVLDVGCGTGALLRALGDRLPPTVQLVGVDPASAMIDVARAARGPRSNVQLEVAFADDLPFPDAQFDLVISTTSFHHWTDQAVGLREVGRVARRDGRLVLVDNFAIGWLRVFNAIARRKMRTRGDVERLLASARLMPLEWARIFDLGPLPLIQAVVAKHAPQSA
jgi:ubiquinone/menaquinone biosynthesis C-methylase UbiE